LNDIVNKHTTDTNNNPDTSSSGGLAAQNASPVVDRLCNKRFDSDEFAIKHLNDQIAKAISKATAKLISNKKLQQVSKSTLEHAKSYDDARHDKFTVEAQLLAKQIKAQQHRPKHRDDNWSPIHSLGLVTKLLKRSDAEYSSPGAKAALKTEIDKLVNGAVWDKTPVEYDAAVVQYSDASFTRIFPIVGLKHSDSATPVFKGRIVIQGSDVRDGEGSSVFFSDTSSSPTSMTAIRTAIAYGQVSGGGSSTADAEAAYIQPLLPDDVHMFITVPDELMTTEMRAKARLLRRPVFRLRRPLYGWSRSGNIWEKHLKKTLEELDKQTEKQFRETVAKVTKHWTPVPEWPQTFWKIGAAGKPVILTVYVDDFVLAGPKHEAEWKAIRDAVKTSTPTVIDRVLGVNHTFEHAGTVTKTKIDMTAYLHQSIEMYNAIPGGLPLRANVHYPHYEPSNSEILNDLDTPGVYGKHSASLLMKLLYCARMARPDLCYAVNNLARWVTKWNKLCDKCLCHLFSYVQTKVATTLHAHVDTSDLDLVEIHAYPDADLAGNFDSARSTSGSFTHLYGPGTYYPLDWASKRQTATSHSTTEAELISASKVLRENLIPLMELWALLLQRPVKGIIHEDNMSTITVINTGYSPQLRHLAKHHRISLGLVHEMCQDPDIDVVHVETARQKGDFLTKGLDRTKHEAACQMVGVYPLLKG
jgi:hypothetical protein